MHKIEEKANVAFHLNRRYTAEESLRHFCDVWERTGCERDEDGLFVMYYGKHDKRVTFSASVIDSYFGSGKVVEVYVNNTRVTGGSVMGALKMALVHGNKMAREMAAEAMPYAVFSMMENMRRDAVPSEEDVLGVIYEGDLGPIIAGEAAINGKHAGEYPFVIYQEDREDGSWWVAAKHNASVEGRSHELDLALLCLGVKAPELKEDIERFEKAFAQAKAKRTAVAGVNP